MSERLRKSKPSTPRPFESVKFGRFHVDACWSEPLNLWYITVTNIYTGWHLHFDYTEQLHKNAVIIARYASKGYTPSHFRYDSRKAIVYLMCGGSKPATRTRRKDKI